MDGLGRHTQPPGKVQKTCANRVMVQMDLTLLCLCLTFLYSSTSIFLHVSKHILNGFLPGSLLI